MDVLLNKNLRLFSGVNRVFRSMEIAEEEIEKTILVQKSDEMQRILFNAFMLVMPTWSASDGYDDCIYRAHCRELLNRIVNGKCSESDLSRTTWSELLVAVSSASYKVPMNNDGASVVARILCGLKEVLGSFSFALDNVLEKMSEYNPSYPDYAITMVNKMRDDVGSRRMLPEPKDIPMARRVELGLVHRPGRKVLQLSLL